MSLLAAYVTNLKALMINFNGQFYSFIKNTKVTLDIKQIAGHTNFYGFGNETNIDVDLEDADYYQVRPNLEDVAAALEFQLSPVTKIWTGISFYHQDINYKENSILNQEQLKIYEDESYLGANFGFQLDTRDYETAPSKGLFLDIRNHNYRMLISKGKGFNKLAFDARAYLKSNILTTSTFALRGNAEKMWGDFPITDAAFLGGKRNLRGFVRERFAGNALLYGGLELRSYLFPLKVIIPGRFGFTAFAETGRVFQSGEESDKWHPSYGGGAWMSFLGRTLIANLTIAKSHEDLLLYITTDFMF
jgi:outer membrane protein assembly factor BamA